MLRQTRHPTKRTPPPQLLVRRSQSIFVIFSLVIFGTLVGLLAQAPNPSKNPADQCASQTIPIAALRCLPDDRTLCPEIISWSARVPRQTLSPSQWQSRKTPGCPQKCPSPPAAMAGRSAFATVHSMLPPCYSECRCAI